MAKDPKVKAAEAEDPHFLEMTQRPQADSNLQDLTSPLAQTERARLLEESGQQKSPKNPPHRGAKAKPAALNFEPSPIVKNSEVGELHHQHEPTSPLAQIQSARLEAGQQELPKNPIHRGAKAKPAALNFEPSPLVKNSEVGEVHHQHEPTSPLAQTEAEDPHVLETTQRPQADSNLQDLTSPLARTEAAPLLEEFGQQESPKIPSHRGSRAKPAALNFEPSPVVQIPVEQENLEERLHVPNEEMTQRPQADDLQNQSPFAKTEPARLLEESGPRGSPEISKVNTNMQQLTSHTPLDAQPQNAMKRHGNSVPGDALSQAKEIVSAYKDKVQKLEKGYMASTESSKAKERGKFVPETPSGPSWK
jgi:hypothetical protein